MDFFETVHNRKSIRRFTSDPVPEEVMRKAFEAATLAPNSSNMQTWNFYWARKPETKAKLVEACLSQSAARTASELVVFTANYKLWKRSNPQVIEYLNKINAPKPVFLYYEKLIPLLYRAGFLNLMAPFKIVTSFIAGLARPITRGPYTKGALDAVAIKSCALACENFALAIAAQGFNTCMMEGFDANRVKKLLKLKGSDQIVMVVAVGREGEKGTWGPRFRIPLEEVLHER